MQMEPGAPATPTRTSVCEAQVRAGALRLLVGIQNGAIAWESGEAPQSQAQNLFDPQIPLEAYVQENGRPMSTHKLTGTITVVKL